MQFERLYRRKFWLHGGPNHISFFGPLMGDEVRLGRLNRKNLAFEGVNLFSKNTYEWRLEDLEEPLDNLI